MKFNDSIIDAERLSELTDLVHVFTGNNNIEFTYHFGTHIQLHKSLITASHFWDNQREEIKSIGYKTDILLRASGSYKHTSIDSLKSYQEKAEAWNTPKFSEQLFSLLEDIRLEELIRKQRPGVISWFETRKNSYRRYYQSQLQTNASKNFDTDVLFNMIYLTLNSSSPFERFPSIKQSQVALLEKIKPLLNQVFEAKSTSDISNLAIQIQTTLQLERDAVNHYFIYPIKWQESPEFDIAEEQLERVDPLQNDDEEEVPDEEEVIQETFSTWHRENENNDRDQSFLQFELEQGTKTSILGDGARETEEGDQAMASVQGHSAQTDQSEYTNLEALEEEKTKQAEDPAKYGKEHLQAQQIDKGAKHVSDTDWNKYNDVLTEIDTERRKLTKTIEKSLEQKYNLARERLSSGRLDQKQLLPLIIENNRRIFYKHQENDDFDAVFTLLIDCSASMFNKMDDVQYTAILFHEVLKGLNINHQVVGFWEDGFEVNDQKQPNYFHRVIPFENCLDPKAGPEILQLEAEEDNRDGYAIRVMTEELLQRSEQQKFLLVFSDGEPSAFNYSENGIIDTHEAVNESRKQQVDVIGIFLGNDTIEEHEELLMQNIYGKHHLMVPTIVDLPSTFAYLLKRLLLRTI
ncbi:vWA domain-containing protein [Halalkalibacillus halophilus]|uniref:vWA domain-containing protein n=1 Tax=Halalkalibacillus halophilus TaxID=392827 RepID=UPI0003FF8B1E|nr:hypothetical protein [Halalkalibacillus halophilus]